MADVPYTPKPGSIPAFLKHIQTAGVPGKVTQQYLKQVGFKSSNDRYLVPIFKALGFIDGSGTPTSVWKDYRNKGQARRILGSAIKSAYSELFSTYPDAHRKDVEAIHNFFSARTAFSATTLDRAVGTFRSLCKHADFDSSTEDLVTPAIVEKTTASEGGPSFSDRSPPTISINIELQIPETSNPTVYENLFAAMRKHLIDGSTDS